MRALWQWRQWRREANAYLPPPTQACLSELPREEDGRMGHGRDRPVGGRWWCGRTDSMHIKQNTATPATCTTGGMSPLLLCVVRSDIPLYETWFIHDWFVPVLHTLEGGCAFPMPEEEEEEETGEQDRGTGRVDGVEQESWRMGAGEALPGWTVGLNWPGTPFSLSPASYNPSLLPAPFLLYMPAPPIYIYLYINIYLYLLRHETTFREDGTR